MVNLPEIIILDEDMEQVSRINSYSSFQWDHNWFEPDTFQIRTNRYKQNVDELIGGGYIAFLSALGEYRVGCVDSIEKPLDENGRISEIWTVDGRGIESILGNREVVHAWATGDGYDTQTASVETNMRHWMNVEALSATDTNRRFAGITLEAVDGHRGGTVEYKARMPKYLTEVLYDLCLLSDLSFRLVWTGYTATPATKTFVFTVKAGTVRTTGAARVVLSVDFGNVKAYTYNYSVLDQKNFIYIGGPGDGAARVLESVHSGTPIPSGWNRKETFVDASECTTADERTVKGNQVLTERGVSQMLDFTFDQTSQTFILGTDFTLGDTVVVDIPDATMTEQITKITESYDTNKGRQFGVKVGLSTPDLISIIARQGKKIAGLSTR